MRISFKAILLSGVCFGSAVSFAGVALAQSQPAATSTGSNVVAPAEVVVTARRRSETLFEAPTTVSAISGATIRNSDITDIQSLMALIPNVVLNQSPEGIETYINIRGTQESDPQSEPNFGLYRNGIYQGGERANLGALIDVDHVEVLRGPQAGLYGVDAVGGAVNIVYAQPTDKFGGYALARYGNYSRSELQGAVNIPVTDDLAVRLTGWHIQQDKGEFYNSYLHEEMDRSRDHGVRFSAKLNAASNLTVNWMAEYQGTFGPATRAYAPNGVTNFLTQSPDETYRTIQRDTEPVQSTRQIFLSQDVRYDAPLGRFEWMTDYRNYKEHAIDDQDGTALGPLSAPLALQEVLDRVEGTQSFYTEGLWTSKQYGPLNFLAGVSYFDENFDFSRTLTTSINTAALANPVYGTIACIGLLNDPTCAGIPGGPTIPFAQSPFPNQGVQSGMAGLPFLGSTIKTTTYSGFLEGNYQVTTALSFSLDLRYTDVEKRLHYNQGLTYAAGSLSGPYLAALFADVVPTYSANLSKDYDKFSPQVSFKYKVDPNVNLYGTISTGFRAGGFNTTTSNPANIPYNEEEAINYELGTKTQWFGGRFTADVAVFYTEQSHLLESQNDPTTPAQFAFSYLKNVGDARNYGVELETTARPLSWLTASVSVGWLNAKITKGDSLGVSLKGDDIELTRAWTVNSRVDVNYPLAGDWRLVGDVNWRLEYGGVLDDNITPYSNLNKVDLVAGIAKGPVRATAYINNIGDDRIVEFKFANGLDSVSYGRTYGVELSYTF